MQAIELLHIYYYISDNDRIRNLAAVRLKIFDAKWY